MARRTFEEQTKGVRLSLALGAAECLALGVWLGAWHLVWFELDRGMSFAVAQGLAIGLLLGCLGPVLRWSTASHDLAVAHGMIPRWPQRWAWLGWLLPGVNLVVPFVMLRERWRYYRLAGTSRISPISSAQALAIAAVVGFASAGAVPLAFLVAGFWAARALLGLRTVVKRLGDAQIVAEVHATAERDFG